ncbi:SlyX family protein [uncultured Maricaulis sp.]|uniref:SlyX family protein n=1 Tax=uncultured Maricaulis sp. TaxID=174710 RepID=UPI0030D9D8C1|tara:strand:+ start:164686 stop:164907 length:222 start_codon:yes stop_codon:yes gene_type:complete
MTDEVPSDVTDRLDTLEAHIAHQDQMLQELSEVMNDQRTEFDLIKARLNQFLDRIHAVEAQGPAPESRPPPHW